MSATEVKLFGRWSYEDVNVSDTPGYSGLKVRYGMKYWPGVAIGLNLTYTSFHLYVLSNLTYTSFWANFKQESAYRRIYVQIYIYIYTYIYIHTYTANRVLTWARPM